MENEKKNKIKQICLKIINIISYILSSLFIILMILVGTRCSSDSIEKNDVKSRNHYVYSNVISDYSNFNLEGQFFNYYDINGSWNNILQLLPVVTTSGSSYTLPFTGVVSLMQYSGQADNNYYTSGWVEYRYDYYNIFNSFSSTTINSVKYTSYRFKLTGYMQNANGGVASSDDLISIHITYDKTSINSKTFSTILGAWKTSDNQLAIDFDSIVISSNSTQSNRNFSLYYFNHLFVNDLSGKYINFSNLSSSWLIENKNYLYRTLLNGSDYLYLLDCGQPLLYNGDIYYGINVVYGTASKVYNRNNHTVSSVNSVSYPSSIYLINSNYENALLIWRCNIYSYENSAIPYSDYYGSVVGYDPLVYFYDVNTHYSYGSVIELFSIEGNSDFGTSVYFDALNLIGSAFNSLDVLFNLRVLPYVTLGTLITIPFAVSIVLVMIRLITK